MPLILGTNSIKDTGYDVANSVRLNRADSANFTRTPSSASNRRTWTWSGWVKRSGLGNIQTLFDGSDGGYPEIFYFDADDKFLYHHDISGSDYKLISSQVFRDVSAWYHIVVAKDTTQSTETNRLKVYVNGSQITMNESALGYPTQNFEGAININDLHIIGNWKTNSYYVDGYLCEVAFVDGTQLDATSFGEFDSDSGIWKPKDFKDDVTFGTNGFYLDFADSADLGDDESGNGNDWTENNITATDQSTDTCTNNFATWNGVKPLTRGALSEGNLVFTGVSGNETTYSSIGASSGKWYFEVKGTTNGDRMSVGCAQKFVQGDQHQQTTNTNGIGYDGVTGSLYVNNSDVATYSTYSNTDIIGVALDLDNRKIYFSVNGTWQNSADPSAGSNGYSLPSNLTDEDFWFFAVSDTYGSGATAWSANFGSPQFSISSGNSDPNGYGNFEYGTENFYALNSKNLAEFG